MAFYEVDGRTEKLFCQFLCLFSKMFLDGKTLFYNTDIFLFYIMTIRRDYLNQDLKQMYKNIKQLLPSMASPSRLIATPTTSNCSPSCEDQEQ